MIALKKTAREELDGASGRSGPGERHAAGEELRRGSKQPIERPGLSYRATSSGRRI